MNASILGTKAKLVIDGSAISFTQLPAPTSANKQAFADGYDVTVSDIVDGRSHALKHGTIKLALLRACSGSVDSAVVSSGLFTYAISQIAVAVKSAESLDNILKYIKDNYTGTSTKVTEYPKADKKPLTTYLLAHNAAKMLGISDIKNELVARYQSLMYTPKKGRTFGPQMGDLKAFYALDLPATSIFRKELSRSIAQAYLNKTLRNVDDVNDFMDKFPAAAAEILAQQKSLKPSSVTDEVAEVTEDGQINASASLVHVTPSQDPKVYLLPKTVTPPTAQEVAEKAYYAQLRADDSFW